MELDPILLKLDKLITTSRLNDIAYIVDTDIIQRLAKMAKVIETLRSGAYLLGSGPSTVGIIPLTVEEVTIGRSATILEEPSDTIIDYAVTDMTYFNPREVSRVHTKVIRKETEEGCLFCIVDLGSTCGTYVNGQPIKKEDRSITLAHGDIISLGASMVSTYMFYIKE